MGAFNFEIFHFVGSSQSSIKQGLYDEWQEGGDIDIYGIKCTNRFQCISQSVFGFFQFVSIAVAHLAGLLIVTPNLRQLLQQNYKKLIIWFPNTGHKKPHFSYSGFQMAILLCLFQHNKAMKMKRPLREQRNMIGTLNKIIWEEQLVDPLIHQYNQCNCNMIISIV